jgi:hypothetical protein
VGHYTQLVWATTHKVGCGFHKCDHGGVKGKPYYSYVCNYCPMWVQCDLFLYTNYIILHEYLHVQHRHYHSGILTNFSLSACVVWSKDILAISQV